MRKMIGRFLRTVCALVLGVSVLTGGTVRVSADDITETVVYPDVLRNYYRFSPGAPVENGMYVMLKLASGEHTYCIEYTVDSAEGEYSRDDFSTWSGMSDAVKTEINEIAYFGYGYSYGSVDHSDPVWYVAAQNMIWQLTDGYETYIYGDSGSFSEAVRAWQADGTILDGINMEPYYSEIRELIREYRNLNMTFAAYHENGEVSDLQDISRSEVIRIEITSGNADRFDLSSLKNLTLCDSSGNPVSGISGNTFYVKAEEAGEAQIVFTADNNTRNISPVSFVLYRGDLQKMYKAGAVWNPLTVQMDMKILSGSLQIGKEDSESGNRPQGDASFAGAVYTVKDAVTGEEAGQLTIADDGTSGMLEDLRTDHAYTIQETTAPEGYELSDEIYTVDWSEGETEGTTVYVSAGVREDVIKGMFRIHKVIADRDHSAFTQDEAGAEFTAVLKRYVEEYGSFEEALRHTDEMTDAEWDVLVTGDDGTAQSSPLAYGTYTVRQTGSSDAELDVLAEDFDVTVGREEKVISYEISNLQKQYLLKLVKIDAETGKRISADGAVFRIFDADGKPVEMQVGSRKYSTFRTASEHDQPLAQGMFCSSDEEKGTVVTPLTLYAGTYTIEETEAPDGYVLLTEPVTVNVGSSAVSQTDKDGNYIIEVEIGDTAAKGKLQIMKKVSEKESDTSLIDRTDLSGIRFSLTAAEDITDPADRSVICRKDEVYGTYETDASGRITAEDIPLGRYTLQETSVRDGMLRNEEIIPVEFSQTDEVTVEYTVDVTIQNQTTMTEFSKKTVTGQDELPGASMQVKDEAGTVIDEWISQDRPHMIEGLTAGKTYVLTETITPQTEDGRDAGYVKATDVSFTVNEDGSVQHVEMIDQTFSVAKQTEDGTFVEGAELCVVDEDGNVADQWITDGTAHRVCGLAEGKTYILRELSAPAGYYVSEDMKFTVSDVKEDRIVPMYENEIRYRIMKTDDRDGSLVEGVTLRLFDLSEADGVIDENTVPVGEWVTTDEPVSLNGILKAGHTYLLEESEYVEGYYQAVSIQFAVPLNGLSEMVTITMVDAAAEVSIHKTDPDGNPLSGAVLQLKDTEGNVIHEWTTQEEAYDLSGYVKGDETYVISEKETPKGYTPIPDITFTVTGTKEHPQIIQAVDGTGKVYVEAVKLDSADLSRLSECEVTVYRKSDNQIARDIYGVPAAAKTDGAGEAYFILPYDPAGYYVLETEAPKGYSINRTRFDADLSGNEGYTADSPVTIRITDELETVHTGIGTARTLAAAFVSIAALCLFEIFRRKK